MSQPTRVLVVDNYDSYTYNLFQLVAMVQGGMLAQQLFTRSGRSSLRSLPHCPL